MLKAFSLSLRGRARPRRALATLAVGTVLALGASACGNDDDTPADTTAAALETAAPDAGAVTPDSGAADTLPPADTAVTTESAAPSDTAAPADSTAAGDTSAVTPADTAGAVVAEGCPPVDGSGPQVRQFAAYPPMCIDPAKTYKAVIETTKGKIVVQFDAAKAPRTVNSFVVLARSHYFDGIVFHRVVPGFVIQGGDPTGTGTGGPGYEFEDELPQAGEYKIGSLAMANAGPNTNGSQFFIITGANGAALPPNYSLFGEVIDGMDVVEAIDKIGQPDPNPPLEKVEMTKVTIEES